MRKLILASLTISSTLAAQSKPRTAPLHGSLERRLATLLDQPPFSRANWGVYVVDDGKVLFARNADRFYVPASNTKLVVSAAATVLLPADYRVTTSVYANGRVDNGVLYGDLVLYGRGDPTWSERAFSVGSLAPGTGAIRDEGPLARVRKPRVESAALAGASRYAVRALAASLMKKGVSVEGGTAGTCDSLAAATGRGCCAPLVEYRVRALTDIIF